MQPIDFRDDPASETHRAAMAHYLRRLERHPERDLESRAEKWARALGQALRRIGRRSGSKSSDDDRGRIGSG